MLPDAALERAPKFFSPFTITFPGLTKVILPVLLFLSPKLPTELSPKVIVPLTSTVSVPTCLPLYLFCIIPFESLYVPIISVSTFSSPWSSFPPAVIVSVVTPLASVV